MFIALGTPYEYSGWSWIGSCIGTSADGEAWTFHPINDVTTSYSGMAHGNGLAVVVGASGCYGFIPCSWREIVSSSDKILLLEEIDQLGCG